MYIRVCLCMYVYVCVRRRITFQNTNILYDYYDYQLVLWTNSYNKRDVRISQLRLFNPSNKKAYIMYRVFINNIYILQNLCVGNVL